MVKLHVNVDHVASLRQARGTPYPDPTHAALVCEESGASGITVHLREDRRHIQESDVRLLRQVVQGRLNLEMAPTPPMLAFAREVRPDMVTLVPEKRQELTTEGGLDLLGNREPIESAVADLRREAIEVSLFVDAESSVIGRALALEVNALELHTGRFAAACGIGRQNPRHPSIKQEIDLLRSAADRAVQTSSSLTLAAGHGLNLRNLSLFLASVPCIEEVNIGHALVCEAVFLGLRPTVARYLQLLDLAPRRARKAQCNRNTPEGTQGQSAQSDRSARDGAVGTG